MNTGLAIGNFRPKIRTLRLGKNYLVITMCGIGISFIFAAGFGICHIFPAGYGIQPHPPRGGGGSRGMNPTDVIYVYHFSCGSALCKIALKIGMDYLESTLEQN